MAGLSAPWASREDALLWLQMTRLAAAGALLATLAALLAWALLLQPTLAWWHGAPWRIATDAIAWRGRARLALTMAALLFALFLAFLAWYGNGMLRGQGKAEH